MVEVKRVSPEEVYQKDYGKIMRSILLALSFSCSAQSWLEKILRRRETSFCNCLNSNLFY